MTKIEAENLKTFKHRCNCGGYAWTMNGRPENQPHMSWCPQFHEYRIWYKALNSKN